MTNNTNTDRAIEAAEEAKDVLADAPDVATGFSTARRKFMTRMGLMGAAAGVGMAGLGSGTASAALPIGFRSGGNNRRVVDTDIINFALNLEYLEAEYYLRAALGRGLAAGDTDGLGTLGSVTGGRQVDSFVSSPNSVIAQYAREIAADEEAHVRVLRGAAGRKKVARPALNISTAFTEAAIAAGVITAGQTFDPYASDLNFLIGAFIFEDVGVTAYNGASTYIQNEAVLGVAAKILAVEAYHAGEVRTVLFNLAQTTPSIFDTIQKISDLRDTVDGTDGENNGDVDQGIGAAGSNQSNIVPTDANGLSFSRSFRQVLNIVYNGPSSTFGFFPNRLNGNIR